MERNPDTWAILATGQSMNLDVAQSVMGKCSVIAVSDGWRLAPWADVLVSSDAAWWAQNPDAVNFPRRKFTVGSVAGVEKFEGVTTGSNSGLLALHVARHLGAKKVLLLGFDMHGTHYFGKHPFPLKNTTPHRFEIFKSQFARYKPRDMEIINCTATSALNCYTRGRLKEHLC